MTKVIVATGRCVTTHDFFSIELRGDGYMLANRETENIIRVWQSKAIALILVSITRINESKPRTWRCLRR